MCFVPVLCSALQVPRLLAGTEGFTMCCTQNIDVHSSNEGKENHTERVPDTWCYGFWVAHDG